MSDRKTFEYGGYHFTPIRKFQKKEGDFFAISKRLASDPNLGLCTYQGRQKVDAIIKVDTEGYKKACPWSIIKVSILPERSSSLCLNT